MSSVPLSRRFYVILLVPFVVCALTLISSGQGQPRSKSHRSAMRPGVSSYDRKPFAGQRVLALVKPLVARADSPNEKDQALSPEITNSIGMKLRLIPAGRFLMGSPKNEKERFKDEGPQHEVQITKEFYVGKYEVTQREFVKVMGSNPSWFHKGRQGGPDHPVECVNWYDCVEFCNKLSKKEGRQPCYRLTKIKRAKADNILSAEVAILHGRNGYRLPTGAEWEYCCRVGSAKYQVFCYGDSLSSNQANFKGNSPYGGAPKGPYLRRTTKVGSYAPNGFGLYDLHGNVCEWCQDWYQGGYHKNSPKRDPQGPTDGTDGRVVRGGGWGAVAVDVRTACRFGTRPELRFLSLGFRCVRSGSDR